MLAERMTKIFEGMDELMSDALTMNVDEDMFEYMDEKTLKMFKAYMKLYDEAKDLSLYMAKMMDDQDKKLDKIIELLEKK